MDYNFLMYLSKNIRFSLKYFYCRKKIIKSLSNATDKEIDKYSASDDDNKTICVAKYFMRIKPHCWLLFFIPFPLKIVHYNSRLFS